LVHGRLQVRYSVAADGIPTSTVRHGSETAMSKRMSSLNIS
jgi:hypothetical protein